MARIPDRELERLKRTVPIARLVEQSGVTLEKRGRDLVGRCPFHEPDENPSLVISPGCNLFRCFGCGKAGSVIDWRMLTQGESFREAAEALLREYLPEVEIDSSQAPSVEPFSEEEVARWLEATEEELLVLVVAYYRERLEVDLRGKEYLEKRGLASAELVEHFGIGFADRTLGVRLPSKSTKAGEAIRGRLMQLGILRRDSGHEHLNGSVVVPIKDLEGRVVQMYGRKVTERLRKGTPLHLYLEGSLDCVFHPQALVCSDELILCESILDALTFFAAGYRQVSSAFGIQNFPRALWESLLGHGTRRVLIAYDNDEKSNPKAEELGKKLIAEGVEAYRVRLPKGMDVNEYALKLGPKERSLELVLRTAEWMGNGRPPKSQLPALPLSAIAPDPLASKASVSTASGPAVSLSAASLSAATSPTVAPSESPPVDSRPVSVLPAVPVSEMPVEIREHEVLMEIGDRRYRIRGLSKNLAHDTLRVNLLATREDGMHVDTLDLYSSRQRASFLKQASSELGIDPKLAKDDLRRVFGKLEELQHEQIRSALEPQETTVVLTAEEKREALELLSDPRLVSRILEDFARCGVVGEENNKLLGYLAMVSRWDEKPLAVLILSSSAAGKSALLELLLAFLPEELRYSYSAMTGQSLYYMGEKDLRHKVLAVTEEEGAERASYPLKLLQSEGKLSIASTGKDPQSGKLRTYEYHVEGPCAILLTTTAVDLDEELLNRCLVLTVDESREQTRAIHRSQRQTLSGQLALRRRKKIRRLHQNAQRLLEPLMIVNPFAEALSFPDTCTRTRRDHEKYLAIIRAVTLLYQYQRERKTKEQDGEAVPYIEVTVEDLEIANRLAHVALGRTLDELAPQTRRLLLLVHELVVAECESSQIPLEEFRFTRRWLREASGWGDTQLKVHLGRLVDLEYLAVHRSGHAQRHIYELLYDGAGQDGSVFRPGLIDVSSLGYDANRSGSLANRSGENGNRSAPGRPPVGGWSGGGRTGVLPEDSATYTEFRDNPLEKAHLGHQKTGSSNPKTRRTREQDRSPQPLGEA